MLKAPNILKQGFREPLREIYRRNTWILTLSFTLGQEKLHPWTALLSLILLDSCYWQQASKILPLTSQENRGIEEGE